MSYNFKEIRSFYHLEGKILKDIIVNQDKEIIFKTDNETFILAHIQDCCESVTIEDICGIPIQDLIGDPILIAEERVSEEKPIRYEDSKTWTFYELATIKGSVTIRWFGTSNGYYSESVYFMEM